MPVNISLPLMILRPGVDGVVLEVMVQEQEWVQPFAPLMVVGDPARIELELQLSPEGNIPLVLDSGGLGFEFAPLLTIRNRWERANIPSFVPMGNEVVVSLDRFEPGEAFSLEFQPSGQEEDVKIELRLQLR